MISRAAQHQADGGQYLAEFVVEFARNVAQRGFLRGNELLRQFAALRRKFGDVREDLAVVANQIQAGDHDGQQDGCEEKIQLALHAVVNLFDAGFRLLLAFVVLYQQTGNGGIERGLARLQRVANLLASGRFVSIAGQRKHAVGGIPELYQGLAQVAALVAGARGFGQGFFLFQRYVQIVADAVELRAPSRERVRFAGIEHVTHGQADGVQIILDAQKLQRVFTIAVDHPGLQLADPRKL